MLFIEIHKVLTEFLTHRKGKASSEIWQLVYDEVLESIIHLMELYIKKSKIKEKNLVMTSYTKVGSDP